jgi:hypothetical protein
MTPFFNNDAVSGESAVGSLLSFLGLMLYLLGLLLYLLGSFLALLGSLLSWFGTLFSWTSALVTILFSTTLRASNDVESGRGQFSTPYFGACLPRRLIIWLMIDFKDLALSGIATLTWLRCGKASIVVSQLSHGKASSNKSKTQQTHACSAERRTKYVNN